MNRFIMADAEKCIGCRTCEVACAVSHQDAVSAHAFTPRLRVVKGDDYTTAVGCHQCEDAPCANVCPTHAISRTAGAWLVEQTRCIGCKSCMVACPFGAMTVAVQQSRPQAIKCDLCRHREEGPACVAACPTQALACIDVGQTAMPKLM